jgi:hypothetical protein
MSDLQPVALLFEDLVRQILASNGFDVHADGFPRGNTGFDFIATSENERWAIEVKHYRTARAQASLLEAASARLVSRGLTAHARKAMLVVSCELSPTIRKSLTQRFTVLYIDRNDLLKWAASVPSLLDSLSALLELTGTQGREAAEQPAPSIASSEPLASVYPQEDLHGGELCEELRALKRGKGTWAKYEALCDRILRYLFPNDLQGWHKQRGTDDGLSRFDYICRVRRTTEFWRFLIDQLDSRYVLFEFKNYAGPIKQGQVLTTEKYLLEKALRKVAIILCREGASPDALKMTQGAMREHGKLMIIVDDNTVCEMLHMKQRGEDPTDRLFDLADGFLMSLPR